MFWFEGDIVTDWKKAQNLAQMLFRVSKTNLEGLVNDPIIQGGEGGGDKTSISFSAFSVSLKLKFTSFLLTNIHLYYQTIKHLWRGLVNFQSNNRVYDMIHVFSTR